MSAPSGDRARVSVFVRVPVDVAFAVFTEETDLWWKRGPRFRHSGRTPGVLQFEPGVGGRLFEQLEGPPARVIEVGRNLVWDPPGRIVFEWRNANFAPDERTEVEITFEAHEDGTKVTLEHRGWSALRPDHPARHGKQGNEFAAMIGMFWGELLTALREHAAVRTP